MKRKLVKQAGQAVTITLPIQWIREHNLKAGDEIDIQENEKNLILQTENKTSQGKVTIDGRNFKRIRMTYHFLNAAYTKGIDEVTFLSKKCFIDLQQQMGYAVIQQKGEEHTMQDISGTATEKIDDIFKRVFQMVITNYEKAMKDIFNEQKENHESIRQSDVEINKFTNFLERAIMKQTYADAATGKILFAFAFSLERIGDTILRLWRPIINYKSARQWVKNNKEAKELSTTTQTMLEKAFLLYYNPTAKVIEETIQLREKAREQGKTLLEKGKAVEFVMHTLKIAEDAYDLTQLSLMKSMEGNSKKVYK